MGLGCVLIVVVIAAVAGMAGARMTQNKSCGPKGGPAPAGKK
jgi:hypothetical protein